MQTLKIERVSDKRFNVLDHGFVELRSLMGSDITIEQDARTSYTGGELDELRPIEKTRRLLRHLMRKYHTSPFEMAVAKFRLSMPIFVWRQHIRHRTASLNEISGRYATLPDLYYCPPQERIAPQSTTNKQGSGAPFEDVLFRRRMADSFAEEQRASRQAYEARLDLGMTRELARINVPVSQYTCLVWQMNLHNLMHYIWLRYDDHAQEEIKVYAEAMLELLKPAFPITIEAFMDFRVNARTFSAQDLRALSMLLKDVTPSGMGVHKSDTEETEFWQKIEYVRALTA